MPDPKKKFKVERKGSAYKTDQTAPYVAPKKPSQPKVRIKTVELDEVVVSAPRKKASARASIKSIPKSELANAKTAKAPAKKAPVKKAAPVKKDFPKTPLATKGVKKLGDGPKASLAKKKVETGSAKLRAKGEAALASGNLGKAKRLARRYKRSKK